MRQELSREQAVAMAKSEWWKDVGARQAFASQATEERLCMPFGEFHLLAEVALGRGVFTHEFANPDRLLAELSGEVQPPSLQDILELIPEEKRIVVCLPQQGEASNG